MEISQPSLFTWLARWSWVSAQMVFAQFGLTLCRLLLELLSTGVFSVIRDGFQEGGALQIDFHIYNFKAEVFAELSTQTQPVPWGCVVYTEWFREMNQQKALALQMHSNSFESRQNCITKRSYSFPEFKEAQVLFHIIFTLALCGGVYVPLTRDKKTEADLLT